MNASDLIGAKRLTTSYLGSVAVSVTASGSPAYYRLRLALNTTDFHFLFANSSPVNPQAIIHGDAAHGISVNTATNGGSRVTMQSKKTVTMTSSAKNTGCTENRVGVVAIPAVFAEYEDGTRYMLTGPLPDPFLSTTARTRRQNSAWRPTTSAKLAFEHAGAPLKNPNEPATKEVVAAPIVPTETVPLAPVPITSPTQIPATDQTLQPEPTASPAVLSGKAETPILGNRTMDLKTLIEMANEAASKLREEGMQVDLRVEDGAIRGKVEVRHVEEF